MLKKYLNATRPVVVQIIPSLGSGGAERVACQLANHWASTGWQVYLLTFDSVEHSPFYDLNPLVDVVPLAVAAPSFGRLDAILKNFRRVSVIRQMLKVLAPNVIVSHMDRTNITVLLANLRLGIPLIITEHSVPDLQDPGQPWRSLRSMFYRYADLLVVLTDSAANYFRSVLKIEARVIPNSIAIPFSGEHLQGRQMRDTLSLCAIGRFTREKGFDLLLEAFALVAQRLPTATLSIWGDGPLLDELVRRRDHLGLNGRVHFQGVTRDVFHALRSSDLFVLPSRHEGFGNVILEAMASGTPVVSFDCPYGPRSIIEDGVDGKLVPAGDVEALSNAIVEILHDPQLRTTFAANGLKSVQRFAPEQILPKWDELLDTFIPKGSSKDASGRKAARKLVPFPAPFPRGSGRRSNG